MGVGPELLGKHVRCPHCKQVVLAPSPTGSPAAPVGNQKLKPRISTSNILDPESESLSFNFPRKREGADSILSEAGDSDDEVLSARPRKKLPSPLLPDGPGPSEPPKTEPLPAPPEMPSNSELPTIELHKISAVEGAMSSAPAKPLPPTTPPPLIIHTPPPAAPVSPFEFDAAHPRTVPSTKLAAQDATRLPESRDRGPSPHETGPTAHEAPGSEARLKRWMQWLAIYSLVVTAIAIYGLFFRSSRKLDPGHPLSTIPDSFGEFDPALRKKVSKLRIDWDAPLPEHQRASLGKTIAVGSLEIEPIAVEARPLTIVQESKTTGQSTRNKTNSPALVLHLRVKNTSSDLTFCPLDPAFNRRTTMDKIGTQIAVGKQTFPGGPIGWPFTTNLKRVFEANQEDDAVPLQPGETRDYFVCSDTDSRLRKAVRDSTEPILWRVQVRRGLIDFKGKDVPVTAVIGVEFQSSDVKNLN